MTPIFEKLTVRLDEHNARYRVVHHASAGKPKSRQSARHTTVRVPKHWFVMSRETVSVSMSSQFCLLISRRIYRHWQKPAAPRASLASPAETAELTQCVFGAIPPFSFHRISRLVADPMLFERFQ